MPQYSQQWVSCDNTSRTSATRFCADCLTSRNMPHFLHHLRIERNLNLSKPTLHPTKNLPHTRFSIRTTLCLSLPTLWQVWNSLSLWLYRLNLGTAEQLQRKPPWKRPSFVVCSNRSWARSPPCVRSERSLHPDRGLWPPASSTKRAVMLSPPRPPDSAKSGEKHLKKGANAGDFLQIHGQHGGKMEKTCDFSLIWGFWRLPSASRKEL